jgi:hypothetical protein
MATAMLNRTDRLLAEVLREVREVRSLVEHSSRTVSTQRRNIKKLPKWLQKSLQDVEAGRVYGPFSTVKELMADLNSPGE